MPYNSYRVDLMGTAKLEPCGTVEVDSYQTFKLTYIAGKFGIDDQGGLKIGFRGHFDGSPIQFEDPKAPGYTTVKASNGAKLDVSWETRRNIRPWNKSLYVRCLRFLSEGDQIEIIFGDTSKGGPGWLMQTFCESAFTFQITVDPFATQDFIAIKDTDHPTISVVPTRPDQWVAVLPTLRRPDEPFRLSIKCNDKWGNPSDLVDQTVTLKATSPVKKLPETVTFKNGDFWKVIEGLTSSECDHLEIYILNEDGDVLTSSNTLVIRPSERQHFWSDMHAQSGETIGVGTAREYFEFARNKAFVDIAGHQGNDFQITDAFWEHLNELTAEYNEPGRFLTIPGYEWSGNTGLGGDHNVWYRTEGRPIYRSSRALVADTSMPENDAHSAVDMMTKLEKEDAIVVAHVGGRYADIKYAHDAKLEPSVEVHSSWGTFEWILNDAFDCGYKIGIVASSDGHKGRPGSEFPGNSQFGSFGGLTCHLLPELDRDHFFSAFRRRQHYATTGARIFMDVTAQIDETVHQIGEIIQTTSDHVTLNVEVIGTAPLERIDVFDGKDIIETIRPWDLSNQIERLRITCAGQHYRGRGRLVKWEVAARLDAGQINKYKTINFWNPNRQPKLISETEISWETVTTGGASAVDLWLDGFSGSDKLFIETNQGSMTIDANKIEVAGVTQECGGMDIRLNVQQLPQKMSEKYLSVSRDLKLTQGTERRLFVRVTQEDGHQAWTSPFYILRS